MRTGYILGSIYISQEPIKHTYKTIHDLANTRKHENKFTSTYATHAITLAWTFPILPSILTFYPPYYTIKKLKQYINQ